MEPTKQNQGGKPFGRGANNSYSPEQLARLWSNLVEQGMPPPQGGDVVGDSSARAGIHGVGNIRGHDTPAIPRPLAVQRPSEPIPINSQCRHPSSRDHRPGPFAHFADQAVHVVDRASLFPAHGGDVVNRAALFPAHGGDAVDRAALFPAYGGDAVGRPALYDTSLDLDPYAAAHLVAQLSGQPAPTSFNQRWQPMPSSSGAHQRQPSSINFPQPGADTGSSARPWGDNGSLYQYTSVRQAASLSCPQPDADPAWRLRQSNFEWFCNRADAQLGSRAPAVLTPEELRRLLLQDQDNAALVMNPHNWKPIASLLDQGGQEDHHTAVRIAVLSRITSDVHTVMASDAGAEVFVALLRAIVRASKSKRLELNAIIQAAASPNARSRLMGVANQEPGETALKELFRVLAEMDRPELCEPLVNCLIDGWITEQHNGPELLRYLFTTLALPYQYCTTFIRRLAIPRFREMVMSEFGWMCMVECLRNARDDELTDLEQTVLNDTVEIAKSQFGYRFLLEVLEGDHRYYRPQLKNGIWEWVERNSRSQRSPPPSPPPPPPPPPPPAQQDCSSSSSTPSSSASVRERLASSTPTSSPVRGDCISLDPGVAAFQRADDADVEFRGELGRVRDLLLTRVLEPGDLDFAGSSPCVDRLLLKLEEQWYITVRRNVFKGIMRDLRTFMESREWHVVFLQFLREDRFDDLKPIIDAICRGVVPVMRIADSECGEASLIGLMRVLARLRLPCRERFIDHLLSKGLMEQSKDPGLLPHIFAEFPYEDSSSCIRHAIGAFNGGRGPLTKFMLNSIWICLLEATGVDLHELEDKILSDTARLAKGRNSHRFLKDILGRDGDSRLKEGIANHIVEHFASLSSHRYGHSLVVECFLRPQLLERVLKGFLDMSDDQLAALVEDRRGCYVIRRLLLEAKKDYPDETKTLAVWVRDLMPDASDDPPT
ncbi:hypothetical protein BS78_01G450400 [Paspalum vaginatum]|nr:hypothetical protein BS78_01G450400 [Paspalum vaginatum]